MKKPNKRKLQKEYYNSKVAVSFEDTMETLLGIVVREDTEKPGLMIIKLDDGRHILSTECLWRPV